MAYSEALVKKLFQLLKTVAISAGLATLVPISLHAQGPPNPVTNEYRVTLFPYYPLKDNLTGFGYLGYVKDPDSNYTLFYAGWPGFNYQYKKWLQIWVGSLYIYTDNGMAQDKLELRPFIGPKFFLPNKRRWNLYNFTRYESRSIYDHGTHDWSHINRVRSRFGAEIPITSREKAWKPRTFYAIADVEPFYRFDKDEWDPVRARVGIGYITMDQIRIEFIYHYEWARNPNDDLEYDKNIFRLNIKFGVKHGILGRVLNPD